jgi:hypothetical protein
MNELSHCEWLIVKNQFGGLGRMGLICETKLKKTGISKTLKKFLLYYENVCFWEHFEEKRSHISKLCVILKDNATKNNKTFNNCIFAFKLWTENRK